MTGKTYLLVAALGAAGTGPYVASRAWDPSAAESEIVAQPVAVVSSPTGTPPAIESEPGLLPPTGILPPGVPAGMGATAPMTLPDLPGRTVSQPPISGPPGISLADLLRFDITPRWLAQNWARMTTCLTEPQWQGFRVPVVTGSQFDDLAGTASYSFNMQQQLERIHLYGVTSDCEPLTAFAEQRLGMRQYPSPVGVLFMGFYGEEPLSMLRIRNMPLQEAQQTGTRYEVDWEMNLPRPGAKLSEDRLQRWRTLLEFQKQQSTPAKLPPAPDRPPTL